MRHATTREGREGEETVGAKTARRRDGREENCHLELPRHFMRGGAFTRGVERMLSAEREKEGELVMAGVLYALEIGPQPHE